MPDGPAASPPADPTPAAGAMAPPGWYGKLPALGDFAQRRLPPDLVQGWDDWLAAGLGDWQAADPEGWLERYLAGPSWRFLALPGALPGLPPPQGFAGVLMPSVDRVGRYFPFTLGWLPPAPPENAAALAALCARVHQLDDLALDALHEDWPVDRLEAELAAWSARQADGDAASPAPADTPALPARGTAVDLAVSADIAATLVATALAGLAQHWHGGVLWWTQPAAGAPRLRLSHGLPAGAAFTALFDPPDPLLQGPAR